MRLRRIQVLTVGPLAAGLAMSGAQAQTPAPACNWPPPLVCPPTPPNGPRTVTEIDNLIRGIDATIGAHASAEDNSGWAASAEAKEKLNDYVGELKDYREKVADYREKMQPDESMIVAYGQDSASDPE
jgi:hypothetical protein